MTYREKLQKEYPEMVNDKWYGGCHGCPKSYDYGPEQGPFTCGGMSQEKCTKCWDTVIPGTEDDEYEKLTRDELITIIKHLEGRIEIKDKVIANYTAVCTDKNERIKDLEQKLGKTEGACSAKNAEIVRLRKECDECHMTIGQLEKEVAILKDTVKDREMRLAVYRTQAMQTYGTCCCNGDINILVQKNKHIEELINKLEFERAHKDYWYNECHNLSKKVCERDDIIQRLEKELQAEKKEHAKHHGFFAYFH